jgi:hypothetical protein
MGEWTWVLGASDPEMETIETVLRKHGQRFRFAVDGDGRRVTPATAYRDCRVAVDDLDADAVICVVECDPRDVKEHRGRIVVDHHRPGDPGYGRSPAEYMRASSLGQVMTLLGLQPTDEHRLVAAADHCLAAAYRGECPGVDPDALMRWRAQSRAGYQGRSPADVLADVERAREALRRAPRLDLSAGVTVADMRDRDVPELPEAAARDGVCFIGALQERGRTKVVCQAGSPEQISAFLQWAPANGLVDLYGDPARGFAGGYLR